MASCTTLQGAIFVVSDQTFLFVLGHNGGESPSPTWNVLLHSVGVFIDATLGMVPDDGGLRLRIGKSIYTMHSVSNTLLRWRLEPESTWTFCRQNLPRPRGSCWRIDVSHPRYEQVYQTYVGALKQRFPGIPRTTRYLTRATMLKHASTIAVPTVATVPRDRVRRQLWLGRVTS